MKKKPMLLATALVLLVGLVAALLLLMTLGAIAAALVALIVDGDIVAGKLVSAKSRSARIF